MDKTLKISKRRLVLGNEHLWFFITNNIITFQNYRWISEALKKMKGKIPEIAGSHVSSRVLQVIFGVLFINAVPS